MRRPRTTVRPRTADWLAVGLRALAGAALAVELALRALLLWRGGAVWLGT